MKRCPSCQRVESDEALKFCRFDGATLVIDSSSIDHEAGTVRLDSGQVRSDPATRVLPYASDASLNGAATTVLSPQPTGFSLTKRRNATIAIIVAAVVVLAVGSVVFVASYVNWTALLKKSLLRAHVRRGLDARASALRRSEMFIALSDLYSVLSLCALWFSHCQEFQHREHMQD